MSLRGGIFPTRNLAKIQLFSSQTSSVRSTWFFTTQQKTQLKFQSISCPAVKIFPYYNLEKNDFYLIKENQRKLIINNVIENMIKKSENEALSINNVKELSRNPYITIGAHTVNHPIFTDGDLRRHLRREGNITNKRIKEVMTRNPVAVSVDMMAIDALEILQSKKDLEKWINKKVKYFAYPNGEYNGREKNILKNSGFSLAATCENKKIEKQDDLFLIPRFVAMDKGFFLENVCHMMGIWNPALNKIRSFLNKFVSFKILTFK